jgi:hypothetical protein
MKPHLSDFISLFGRPVAGLLQQATTPEYTQPVEQDLYEPKQFESKKSLKKRLGKKKPRAKRRNS